MHFSDRMKRQRPGRRPALIVGLLVAVALLAGCADGAPSAGDLAGIQRILVFPFLDEAGERGLNDAVGDGLVARLGAVGWYETRAPERVAAPLAERRLEAADMDLDDPGWLDVARELALDLEVDAFIVGSVTDRRETTTVGEAYYDADGEEPAWFADQRTEAEVTVRAKLVNVHTGETVYDRTTTGRGRVVEARRLNWVVPSPPPEHLLPAPHRRDAEAARTAALHDALARFEAELLPRSAGLAED